MTKQYLGDGVYADVAGHALVLTSENGEDVLDLIVIEPHVLEALLRYSTAIRTRDARSSRVLAAGKES